MSLQIKLLIVIILLPFSNLQNSNPLIGEWSFIEGFSNEKATFKKEHMRKKFFNKDFSFHITQITNGKPQTTIKGIYEIKNKSQFKEVLGVNFSVTYDFVIKTDTLSFQGNLRVPLSSGGFKSVYVKEKWVRIN